MNSLFFNYCSNDLILLISIRYSLFLIQYCPNENTLKFSKRESFFATTILKNCPSDK